LWIFLLNSSPFFLISFFSGDTFIKKTSNKGIWVIPDDKNMVTRFLFVFTPSAAHFPKAFALVCFLSFFHKCCSFSPNQANLSFFFATSFFSSHKASKCHTEDSKFEEEVRECIRKTWGIDDTSETKKN